MSKKPYKKPKIEKTTFMNGLYLVMVHFYTKQDASDHESISIQIEKEKAEAICTLLQHPLPNETGITELYTNGKLVITISLI